MSERAQVIELGPHTNMSPAECLSLCARDSASYQDVIVVGIDEDGALFLRSSHISRADATFVMMDALDRIRGIERQ